MIQIDSSGGIIRLGSLAMSWGNADRYGQFPGFTTLSLGDHSVEFGNIDNGNGIFYVRYEDGDIVVNQPLVRF